MRASSKVAVKGGAPRFRAGQKPVSPKVLSAKEMERKKRHEAAQQPIPSIRARTTEVTAEMQQGAHSDRSEQKVSSARRHSTAPHPDGTPRSGDAEDGHTKTDASHEGQSKSDNHSPLRTPLGHTAHRDEGERQYMTRSEKIAEEAHTKLVKAGKKAIALHDLARGFDSKEYRKRVMDFLRTEPRRRSNEMVELFLHMVDKFGFFQKHTKEQQWELAMIAQYHVRHAEEVLFRQEDPPDGLYVLLTGRCGTFKTQGDMRKLVAVCSAGDSVGDIAHLDEKCRRSVTVQISSEKAEFMEFAKDDLDRLAAQWRVEEESEKTQFILTSVPVLNNVPYNILENLSPYFEKLTITKDTVVYRQQDESSAIFFVWEGNLQIMKRIDLIKSKNLARPAPLDSSGKFAGTDTSLSGMGGRGLGDGEREWQLRPKKQSRSVQIAMVGPGEYFGEVEVFNDVPRGSAVVAVTDCVLLSLSRQSLTEAMPQSFLSAVFRYSSMRVQWRNSRLLLVLDNLLRINWIPERDPKAALEPELKPLAKMRSVLLPMLAHPGSEQRTWLGAHTVLSEEDAREWGLYHHGGWARAPDKADRVRDEKMGGGGGGGRKARDKSADEQLPPSAGEGGTAGGAQQSLVLMLRARKAELLGASYFSTAEMKVGAGTVVDS